MKVENNGAKRYRDTRWEQRACQQERGPFLRAAVFSLPSELWAVWLEFMDIRGCLPGSGGGPKRFFAVLFAGVWRRADLRRRAACRR